MKAAILGLSHPHAGILLTTLQNLPEITSVSLWDADPAVAAKPALPASPKAAPPTTDLDAKVGGFPAASVDFADYLGNRLPWIIGSVLVVSFLLLMCVFRSLLVPLKAVLLNLLISVAREVEQGLLVDLKPLLPRELADSMAVMSQWGIARRAGRTQNSFSLALPPPSIGR